MKMELHLKFVKTGCGTFSFVVGKMFNDVPSYRVGKEIRADLKGSLSFPTSITRKGTRYLNPPCAHQNDDITGFLSYRYLGFGIKIDLR